MVSTHVLPDTDAEFWYLDTATIPDLLLAREEDDVEKSRTDQQSSDLLGAQMTSASDPPTTLRLTYRSTGSGKDQRIWQDAENAIILHACNCQGIWGAGFANAVKAKAPVGFKMYRNLCREKKAKDIIGKALLLPPSKKNTVRSDDCFEHNYLACVFTSQRYGRSKDSEEQILAATRSAFQCFFNGLHQLYEDGTLQMQNEIRMVKINSGLFAVPWQRTVNAIGSIVVPAGMEHLAEIFVYGEEPDLESGSTVL